jgi:hypothetical protein
MVSGKCSGSRKARRKKGELGGVPKEPQRARAQRRAARDLRQVPWLDSHSVVPVGDFSAISAMNQFQT